MQAEHRVGTQFWRGPVGGHTQGAIQSHTILGRDMYQIDEQAQASQWFPDMVPKRPG